MSPAPFFHGWSSGYLRPAFLGWEGQEALASIDTGAGRLVHTGLVSSEVVHARRVAGFIQPGRVPVVTHWSAGYEVSLVSACSKAVSIGRAPMKTACDKKMPKTCAAPDADTWSVKDDVGPAVCTKGSSPSKTVRPSSEPFRITQ